MQSTTQTVLLIVAISVGMVVLWGQQQALSAAPSAMAAAAPVPTSAPAPMRSVATTATSGSTDTDTLRAQLDAVQAQLASLAGQHAAVVEQLSAVAAQNANAVAPTLAPMTLEEAKAANAADMAQLESSVHSEMASRSADPVLAAALTEGLEAFAYTQQAQEAQEAQEARIDAIGVDCVESLCTVDLDHAAGQLLDVSDVFAALAPSFGGQMEAFIRSEPMAGGRERTRIYLATGAGGLPDDLDS